ncbi:hypothetical protein Y032_0230g2973 [Ancylostoma ceylanicum]|uniref:Peptidase S1 domain-containing protein n=1 Tax=Ancylostoma ceylanicum TaxID=53326 RepID=A0A016SGT5_9BILA|nr:hypothetical protein Y032_0230g2973 [Ancylostoma ceylanicum]
MNFWITLLIWITLNLLANGRKLTTTENELNSRNCGVHFLGESSPSEKRLSKKSIGGRQFEKGEYPWTVMLVSKRSGLYCSGVQISPRHILTAAHCALEFDDDYNLQCRLNRSYSVVSVIREPDDILVYIGGNKTDCDDPLLCPHYKAIYPASKIIVNNVDLCSLDRDIALIELCQNISETHSTPICMPMENLQLDDVLYASGSGMDLKSPVTLTDPNSLSRGQQVVALKLFGVDETSHKIVTRTFLKGILPGDSGGPLFQVNDTDKHTLVGITSGLPLPLPQSKVILQRFQIFSTCSKCKVGFPKRIGDSRAYSAFCQRHDQHNRKTLRSSLFPDAWCIIRTSQPRFIIKMLTVQYVSDVIAYFTDVRAYLEWICKYSGVCPIEESEEFDLDASRT